MKILVTAFDPFGEDVLNPSARIIKELPERILGAEVRTLLVPTVFYKSIVEVCEMITKEKPDFVLLLGQAGGRVAMTMERVAININDARLPDNAGHQPLDEPIIPEGPSAYFSTMPMKAMVAAMRGVGVPADVSNSAGTFVCNHLLYGVLNHCQVKRLPVKVGFLHVPYLPEQVAEKKDVFSLSLGEMVKAVEAALAVALSQEEDLKLPLGTTH